MCHMNTKTPVAICMAQAAFARERVQANWPIPFYIGRCTRVREIVIRHQLILAVALILRTRTAVHCYCVAIEEEW